MSGPEIIKGPYVHPWRYQSESGHAIGCCIHGPIPPSPTDPETPQTAAAVTRAGETVHEPSGVGASGPHHCTGCGEPWPCPTYEQGRTIVRAVLSDPGTPQTAAGRALWESMTGDSLDGPFGASGRMLATELLAIEAEARAARDAEVRALRQALHDTMATVAFLRSVVASGERLNTDDEALMRARYETARAILSDTPETGS